MIWWPTEIPTLQYGLLTLRPLNESDIPSVYEGVQDPLIPQFTTIPAKYTIESAEHFVNVKSPDFFVAKKEIPFAMIYDEVFAGVISLHSIDLPDHCSEIGYWMAKHMRGRGICTNAAKLITEYGFTTMGFRRIEAVVDVTNEASKALLLSAGFSLEGIMRDRVTREDGTQKDMALFSVLAR